MYINLLTIKVVWKKIDHGLNQFKDSTTSEKYFVIAFASYLSKYLQRQKGDRIANSRFIKVNTIPRIILTISPGVDTFAKSKFKTAENPASKQVSKKYLKNELKNRYVCSFIEICHNLPDVSLFQITKYIILKNAQKKMKNIGGPIEYIKFELSQPRKSNQELYGSYSSGSLRPNITYKYTSELKGSKVTTLKSALRNTNIFAVQGILNKGVCVISQSVLIKPQSIYRLVPATNPSPKLPQSNEDIIVQVTLAEQSINQPSTPLPNQAVRTSESWKTEIISGSLNSNYIDIVPSSLVSSITYSRYSQSESTSIYIMYWVSKGPRGESSRNIMIKFIKPTSLDTGLSFMEFLFGGCFSLKQGGQFTEDYAFEVVVGAGVLVIVVDGVVSVVTVVGDAVVITVEDVEGDGVVVAASVDVGAGVVMLASVVV
eukprot:403374202